MAEERKGEKLRLNITVDEDIVKRAKDMGFNISAAFEEYLRVLTYNPEGKTDPDVVRAYDMMLYKIQPILKRYNTEIEIGEITNEKYSQRRNTPIDFKGSKIMFDAYVPSIFKDGKSYVAAEYDPISKDVIWAHSEDLEYFYKPEKILQNLIIAIKKTASDNTSKVQKLNLASKFVQALFSDIENSSESGIETPLFRQILADAGVKPLEENTNSHLEEENKEILA